MLTTAPDRVDERPQPEVTRRAGASRAHRRDVQRREPRPGATARRSSTQLAKLIVDNLRSPDIVALEEVQDNNGADERRHRRRDAHATSTLIAAIQAAGGPTYAVPPDRPGQQPGRRRAGRQHPRRLPVPDRPRARVRRPARAAADDRQRRRERPSAGRSCSFSPGPHRPDEPGVRQQPQAAGRRVHVQRPELFVIANHFNSKGGDEPLFGRFQPPTRRVGGPAPPAGADRQRLRRPDPGRRPERRTSSCSAT